MLIIRNGGCVLKHEQVIPRDDSWIMSICNKVDPFNALGTTQSEYQEYLDL